ncbi:hypothetical protein M9H77_02557 [Catharanthus roseus]|uniref:Uncharacterized protein n=1 Tax=Catharanthus roseus TaxID=4058 RepID=A0ACC0C8V0_CATRO|nr:hypothetical protein M9H77_02557 [Catharanthus roseus]
MEYNWSNTSWKRMEVKSKQENSQSKFARDMHSFHHSGVNGFNAFGGNNHRNGNFTSRRCVGVERIEKRRNMEKELEAILEELPISLSLKHSFRWHVLVYALRPIDSHL